MKSIAITLAIAGLLIPLPLAAAETTSTFDITFKEPAKADVRAEQVFTGEKSSNFRLDLDNTFGNRDGILNDTEVEMIRESTRADLLEAWHPLIRLNGQPGHITSVEIEFTGLTGPVTSTAEARLVHRMALEFNQTGSGELVFNTTSGVGSFAERGTIRITAPPGFVVEEATGYDEEPGTGERTVEGNAQFGDNIRVTFQEAPQDVGGGNGTPSPGLWAVLLAVGVALAATSMRRR